MRSRRGQGLRETVRPAGEPEAQSLITFDTGARSLVTEDIDTIAAAARG